MRRPRRHTTRKRLSASLMTATGALVATATLSAIATVALAAPAQADTDTGSLKHSVDYTWDQPVVEVASAVPASWGVDQAVRQWNAHRVAGQPRLAVTTDATQADVVIHTVSAPQHWWTGMTTGSADGSTITHIDIALNRASIHQSKYRFAGDLDTAKAWTTSHELGHALGLDHTHVTSSVMSYQNPWRTTGGMPGTYDFRQLAVLYGAAGQA